MRNGITLISVVMTAPDYKVRFKDAAAMLNYGFASCALYVDENKDVKEEIPVKGGVKERVLCVPAGEFRYLDTKGQTLDGIKRKVKYKKSLKAPVKKGAKAGELEYYLNGKKIGSVAMQTVRKVEKAGYLDYLKKISGEWMKKA